jgi:hypothetical protein
MAVLIKYTSGPGTLLRNARRLEAYIRAFGQPIIERMAGGLKLNWIYSRKIDRGFEPKLQSFDLKIGDDEREVVELEIIE